ENNFIDLMRILGLLHKCTLTEFESLCQMNKFRNFFFMNWDATGFTQLRQDHECVTSIFLFSPILYDYASLLSDFSFQILNSSLNSPANLLFPSQLQCLLIIL
ncbi:hypothetical protein H1C71_030769, partial [Ictidomys tridecemlineatus]